MARILLIHHDKGAREMLRLQAVDHQVEEAKDFRNGIQRILTAPPEVVLVSQDGRDEGLSLLRWMRDNATRVPVIVVIGRDGNVYRPEALKLGVTGILEHPVDRRRLNTQVAAAVEAARQALAGPPPLSDEELKGNLSLLENRLNREMKCIAGRNQVFIASSLLGGSAATRPRICLKCTLRAEYGLTRAVYYDFVRDVCCGDPKKCEAVQRFEATRDIA